MQAEYRVCCCAWNDDLPLVDEEPKAEDELLNPTDQADLKCGEKIRRLSCSVTGDTKLLSMKINASEQDCPFLMYHSKKEGKNVKAKGAASKTVTCP